MEGRIRAGCAYRDGNIIHCEEGGECKVELGEDGPFPVAAQKGKICKIRIVFW